MKKFLTFLVLSLLFPISASAMRFESGEDVVLDEPINDDLYVAGGMVEIDSEINGDLIVAGGIVRINGNVLEDLIVAGGNVTVNGSVGDDLKIIGGQVVVTGSVKDDLIGTGGTIEFLENSEIGGSVNLATGFAKLDATIKENLHVKGGTLIFGGTVEGNAILRTEKIDFEKTARIMGNLDYSLASPNQSFIDFVDGELIYTEPESINLEAAWEEFSFRDQVNKFFSTMRTGFIIASLINLLVLGIIFLLIAPDLFLYIANVLTNRPAVSLGIGTVFLFATPVAFALLFITLVGILFSVTLIGIWTLTIFFSKVIISLTIGNLIFKVKNAKKQRGTLFLAFLVGLIIYEIIVNLPILGGLMLILASIFGSGAILIAIYELCGKMRSKKIL